MDEGTYLFGGDGQDEWMGEERKLAVILQSISEINI